MQPAFFDLHDFADRLKEYGNLLCDPDTAERVKELADEASLAHVAGEDWTMGCHPDAMGISIYIPYRSTEYNEEYDSILFSQATMWDDFLKEVYWA